MHEILHLRFLALAVICQLSAFSLFAQSTTVSGIVSDESGPLIGANILVVGKVIGTVTNVNGEFKLGISSPPPLKIRVSMVGYQPQDIEITDANTSNLEVTLSEGKVLGQEVIVSASRVAESVLESPVSIERIDILDIQTSPSSDFYSSLKNLNGIDIVSQSLTFQSVNARGFGANGNIRFVQLIDGIDNQAPGLNFPIGNAVGISELDLESVEVMPGAASALYGPNAIQGILLMNSKSPFDYQGLDISLKSGVNHVDGEDDDISAYHDYGLRFAHAFDNKFAFKVTASYLRANDFRAVDTRDQSDLVERSGTTTREQNRSYDGVNVYGDFPITIGEIADISIDDGNPLINPNATSADIALANQLIGIRSLLPDGENGRFTPTGFNESDFVDNTTESLKLSGAMHYRLTDEIEAITQFNYGRGSSVYTANDRFVLDNFSVWTGKLELRGDNFFVRAYTTQENSGDSYAANTLASLINQNNYLPTYFGAYVNTLLSGVLPSNSYDALHQIARGSADAQQAKPGSEAFQLGIDTLRAKPISEGGAKFLEKSALWHYEGNYNFKNQIDFADIVVGANYRIFDLNSEGTLFALDDEGEEPSMSEWGAYVQIKKKFFDELSLQGSVRYDDNQFFKGQFSPRISSVWEFSKNQNFRASFQRGFRIPTTQDMFIDLDVVTRRLLGRNSVIRNRYNLDRNIVYTTESVAAAQEANDASLLERADDIYREYTTEKVGTWEVGYKGSLLDGKLFVDAFFYQSTYQDLGAEVEIVQAIKIGSDGSGLESLPDADAFNFENHGDDERQVFVEDGLPGEVSLQRYGYDVNIEDDVVTRGFGIAAEYSLEKGYNLGFNVSNNQMVSLDNLVARRYNVSFNTPEWRYNVKFSNREVTDRLGFSLSYRWQEAYLWQSAFGSGVTPAFGTVDAQVTLDLPSIKGKLKVGGSNILNERYTSSFGNPRMGAIYYVQLNFNNLLN